METVKSINGFPSDMIPMKDKRKKSWNLQFSKSFHKSHQKVIDSELFKDWKRLAEGKQEIDRYKKMLGTRERAGKADVSWMNLDYTNLALMPKFIEIIVDKVLETPKELKIKAIDPWSVNEQRKRKNSIISYMLNKELNEQLQGLGVSMQSPFEDGEATPTTIREVDLYLDAYPKNKHVLELHDELTLCFSVNNWEAIARKIVKNFAKVGILGTWSFVDSKGFVRVKPMNVERVITNPVEESDFSDMTRIGEYLAVTIGQIRVMAKDEIARGEITEAQLAALATKVSGNSYTVMNREQTYQHARSYETPYVAPYDNEKVTVLKWQTKSTDSLAYVVTKDDSGRITVDVRDNPYWLDNKGITDEAYREFNLSQGVDRRVERIEVENIYQGNWIVDTEMIFGYGLKGDIQRNVNSLAEAELDAKIFTMDFDSIARRVEPVIHTAQINWLQFLHHSAKSTPDGTAWNKRALTEITVGNKKLDALDLIDMRIQTGSTIFKDVDSNGRPVSVPYVDLKGSDPNRPLHHLDMVFRSIDLIRTIIGLNEVTDASSVNPDQGKGVSEMMISSTNTALGNFYYGHNYIYKETAKSVARLIPDARKYKNAGYIEALGQESQKYWEGNSDLNYMDFSIDISVGWDEKKKATLLRAAEGNLKSAGGSLMPQDVYIILNESNPEKAYLLIEAKTRQRQKEDQQRALELSKANADAQMQSNAQAEEEKRSTLELQEELNDAQHAREMERIEKEYQWKAILLKLERGIELNENEAERYNQFMIASDKNKTSITVAMIGARSKSNSSKQKSSGK